MRLTNTSNRVGLVNLNRGAGAVEVMPNESFEFTHDQLVHGVTLTAGAVVEAVKAVEKPAAPVEVAGDEAESGDNAETAVSKPTPMKGKRK